MEALSVVAVVAHRRRQTASVMPNPMAAQR